MLIGITGQIGAGKSEAARIIKKLGGYVISADRIGRDVVERNPSVLRKLVAVFGPEIISPSGRLRRRCLAAVAFADAARKRRLDAIVHPELLKELNRQTKEALKHYHLVVIDAALLVDWGLQKKVQYAILVHAGKDIRTRRLLRKGYRKEDIDRRMESQLSLAVLRKQIDFIIMNNKSLDSLEVRLKKIVEKLNRKG
jgi:dephospho-CoA kinase